MMGEKPKRLSDQKIVEGLLKELRIKSGLRQVDVAEALCIKQSMVSKYEVGERRLDILEIRKLCEIFGITLGQFFEMLEERLGG